MKKSERFALFIMNKVGTIACFFLFWVLAFVSFPAAIDSHNTIIIVAWITQTFLQLVLLPLIIIGQNLQMDRLETMLEKILQMEKKENEEIEHIMKETDEIIKRS